MEPVTIEALQAELIALKEQHEELQTKFTMSQKDLDKANESLKQAREINGMLYRSVSSGNEPQINNTLPSEEPSKEELFDELVKEAMTPTITILKKRHGEDMIGNIN